MPTTHIPQVSLQLRFIIIIGLSALIVIILLILVIFIIFIIFLLLMIFFIINRCLLGVVFIYFFVV